MIRIVTDTVASIPADMLEGKPVDVVSLFVNRDGVSHVEADMDIETFYSGISGWIDDIPTSSQPSQQVLEEAFSRIAQAGDELLGIFVSSGLSGTYNGVVRAAHAVKSRIPEFKFALMDSYSCAFDEGWSILEAAEAVRKGFDLNKCIEAVTTSMKATRFLFTPETLAFLQKGGRIGNAAALLGNLVRLVPVLTVVDSKAATLAKVRQRKKALERILTVFKEDVEAYGFKNIIVHYIGDKAPAVEWAKNAIEPLVGKAVRVSPVSPVVGVHVGPAIGIAYECERAMPYKFPNGGPPVLSYEG
ncbi:MAG: DegV family protein [Eggerthellaceae bacterium]|jgi:DegV family protein with EDD domain|nr:DegV family protein [Eggerthellaceae bacterium]MDR2716268.1 DegV family protein [Coriobacteriaceae bacterium]